MTLCEPGTKIENQPNSKTAIVSGVVPNSQGEAAGLRRVDIVCHAELNGEHEFIHDQLVKIAASEQRLLEFNIRRIDTAPRGRNAALIGSTQGSNKGKASADAYVWKQVRQKRPTVNASRKGPSLHQSCCVSPRCSSRLGKRGRVPVACTVLLFPKVW